MIDEKTTLQRFGYTSDELKPRSHKPVIAICEVCGAQREVWYGAYRKLCKPCSYHTDEYTNPGEYKSGEDHPNWKGGVSTWRNALRQTLAYKNWRTAVFKRDDYTCHLCHEQGGRLEAHHIRPVRDHKNDLSVFDIDNGVTLCKGCHDIVNGREGDYIQKFKEMVR